MQTRFLIAFLAISLSFLTGILSAQTAPSVVNVDNRGVSDACSIAYFLVEFDQEVLGVDSADFALNPGSLGGSVLHVGNSSAQLSSTSNRISTDACSGMPTTAICIETWVKTIDGSGSLWDYSVSGDSDSYIRLAGASGLTLHLFNTPVVSTTTAVNDGQWHHVAATWSSSTGDAFLYVDGVQVGSGNGSMGSIMQDDGFFAVSSRHTNSGFGGHTQGIFDEVRVWDHARTLAEIQLDRFMSLRGNEPGLDLYWAMEVFEQLGVLGNVPDIRDLGPNGNHGNGGGSPALISDSPPLDGSRWSVVVDLASASSGGFSVDVLNDGSITAVNGGLALTGPFSNGDLVTVEDRPVLLSVTAPSLVRAGDQITLTGTGFLSEIVDVTIGGQLSGFQVVNDSTMTATVPAVSSSGAVDIVVVGECSESMLEAAVTVDARYEAITLSPIWVHSSGGDVVTIRGQNLDTTSQLFVGLDAVNFTVIDDEALEIIMPPLSGSSPATITLTNGILVRERFVAHGEPVTVPGDFPTIEAAATTPATVGARVILLGSAYYQPVPGSLELLSQSLVMVGLGADRTTIDLGASFVGGDPASGGLINASLQDLSIVNGLNFSGAAWTSTNGMIRGCRFWGNRGASVASFSDSIIEDCEFSGNVSDGANVECFSSRVHRTQVVSNQGSLALLANDSRIYNCLIAANVVSNEVIIFTGYMEFTTIVDNLGSNAAVRTMLSLPSRLILCIVRNGVAFEIFPPEDVDVSFCNIENDLTGGLGNIDVDPMFADPSVLDYRPVPGAPGNDYLVATAWGTDLMGKPRLAGAGFDQGCFESVAVAHPGTNEDLAITSNISLGLAVQGAVPAHEGEYVSFNFASPGGTFTGTVPAVLGQAFATGTTLVQPFPGIAVDLSLGGIFALLDGNAPGPLGPTLLPTEGFSWSFQIPFGLSGFSVMVQGIVFSGQAANGILATTNGFEIAVQ